jgi:hypothetical protein
MDTNTMMPPPRCENCGRDKSATYICDACVNKLNTMHRELVAERDRLAAQNAELTADRDSETRWACQYKAERDAANATLDRLREVVQTGFTFQEVAQRVFEILYPTPETNHEHE